MDLLGSDRERSDRLGYTAEQKVYATDSHGERIRTASRRGPPRGSLTIASSNDRSSASEQTDDEQHDRNHEQHMNECADRIRADDAQQPRDKQDDRENVEHLFLLLVNGASGRPYELSRAR